MDTNALAQLPSLTHLSGLITAVGGLGTAAYGIVDVTKSWNGGVSNAGFASIARTMATLIAEKTPAAAAATSTAEPAIAPALSLDSVLVTLRSNWINGMDSDDQVAIAKSLVKLRLQGDLISSLAALTGVDPALLASVAQKLGGGLALTLPETDVYGRFDLVLTTLLEQAYQRADQKYRNTAKLCAVIAAVVLAVTGAWSLNTIHGFFLVDRAFWQAIMLGLLATPLAPIAKDLSSAIQAGAKAAQAWGS